MNRTKAKCGSCYEPPTDVGGLALCGLDEGHEQSLHVGSAPNGESYQWGDAQAYRAPEADDAPVWVWQHALPSPGQVVDLALANGATRRGEFMLAVFDETGLPLCIVVDGILKRRSIAWAQIVELSWDQS